MMMMVGVTMMMMMLMVMRSYTSTSPPLSLPSHSHFGSVLQAVDIIRHMSSDLEREYLLSLEQQSQEFMGDDAGHGSSLVPSLPIDVESIVPVALGAESRWGHPGPDSRWDDFRADKVVNECKNMMFLLGAWASNGVLDTKYTRSVADEVDSLSTALAVAYSSVDTIFPGGPPPESSFDLDSFIDNVLDPLAIRFLEVKEVAATLMNPVGVKRLRRTASDPVDTLDDRAVDSGTTDTVQEEPTAEPEVIDIGDSVP